MAQRVKPGQALNLQLTTDGSEEFDQLRERSRFIAAVQEGLADVEAGRLLDTHEVDHALDLEFGLLEP